ncbi:aspartyl-phosphate phosphatase Spo0E family protein [Alkalihalobacterium bogoriense]|uniref:aspartyl-phosphate phosphatase Spo0E family protein n=1 Tax=Alkalihalobacterium bogoriense TaxID=246272 RepID=UPI0005580FBA|nr:aspartyl-phosphate phosphatase Spo0E family protein [Alkalihalobacterium bogoriense]
MNIEVDISSAEKIEFIRAQMIETGMRKGLLHPSTIKLSQHLDTLLNNYSKKSFTKVPVVN